VRCIQPLCHLSKPLQINLVSLFRAAGKTGQQSGTIFLRAPTT
jgi:hypothetical protein